MELAEDCVFDSDVGVLALLIFFFFRLGCVQKKIMCLILVVRMSFVEWLCE